MHYTYVWEFEVAAGRREEFLRCYGPDGDWARLFRRAPGYLGTRLLADTARPDRFLTIDRWRSAQEHDDFKRRFRSEYEALDRACEKLTVHEASLGAYWEQPVGEA